MANLRGYRVKEHRQKGCGVVYVVVDGSFRPVKEFPGRRSRFRAKREAEQLCAALNSDGPRREWALRRIAR